MNTNLSLVERAQQLVSMHLRAGDIAIDATVGNGHDTLFLALTVGEHGKVYGFDIQQDALDICYQRLQQHKVTRRVALIHAGHEVMPIVLPEEICNGMVKAVMFNLGYLPGGDKHRTTRVSTTLSALDSALRALSTQGIITVLAYTGHPGGSEEAQSVKAWAMALNPDAFRVSIETLQHTQRPAPELIVIIRL